LSSATLALALLTAGCAGVGSRESAAGSVSLAFVDAISGDNFDKACDLLTPSTRESMEQQGSCSDSLAKASLPEGKSVHDIQVWGQGAQVATDDDTLFLTVIDGHWTVRAAGCRPDPPGPYQCAVQAG